MELLEEIEKIQRSLDAMRLFIKNHNNIAENSQPVVGTESAGTMPVQKDLEVPACTQKVAIEAPSLFVPKTHYASSVANVEEWEHAANTTWPAAVPPQFIISPGHDQDIDKKRIRAAQICGLMRMKYDGLKILDFGCGDGILCNVLTDSYDCDVYGYDIDISGAKSWGKVAISDSIARLPTDFDLIILFDVLDHSMNQSMANVLKSASSLLKDDGIIFIRTHPWTSRHGGHLYHIDNRAYIHLLLSPDVNLFRRAIPNIKVVRPMAAYESAIDLAGLKIIEKNVSSEEVPKFINDDIIKRISDLNYAGNIDEKDLRRILSINFIDYKCSKL